MILRFDDATPFLRCRAADYDISSFRDIDIFAASRFLACLFSDAFLLLRLPIFLLRHCRRY